MAMSDDKSDESGTDPDPTIDLPAENRVGSTSSGLTMGAGDTIGSFKIIQMLGEGGFGIVYLAEQTEPVTRRVALKVIKPGMDTKAVIARFEAERQALAMMDFPGIAKVFEAGSTPEGRPYFAMEYVKGEPITAYCDRHKLDTRSRLTLFAGVCDAIQHAHQKGVIHRDIKPGNILVTIDSRDEPCPKVIDFGIAKATSQSLTQKTVFTAQGELIGTPEYMSPEQAEMSPGDIDTRTDVYALGVVLYELLSGQLPFDAEMLRKAGYAEIQRIIREEDPPKPSTKLTTEVGGRTSRIAELRQTKIVDLQQTLRKELEWIPLKALRKEREERYGSAEALAVDVRRYLSGAPLMAGPVSVRYRLRKALARNKGPAIAILLLISTLMLGVIGTSLFAYRAAEQAKLADQRAEEAALEASRVRATKDFLIHMLASVDPAIAQGMDDALMRQVLVTAADVIDEQFQSMPLVEAEVQEIIGSTYLSLSDPARAMDHLERALELYDEHLPASSPRRVAVVNTIVAVLHGLGDLEAASRRSRENLVQSRQRLGDSHVETLTAIGNHAFLLDQMGLPDEAEPLYQEALGLSREVNGPEHPDTLVAANNLAAFMEAAGDAEAAKAAFDEVYTIRLRTLGARHPATLLSLDNLGQVTFDSGDQAEGLQLSTKAADLRKEVLGIDHHHTLTNMYNVASMTAHAGDFDGSHALHEEVIDLMTEFLGQAHPDTIDALRSHASILAYRSRFPEAVTVHETIVERLRLHDGDGGTLYLRALDELESTRIRNSQQPRPEVP